MNVSGSEKKKEGQKKTRRRALSALVDDRNSENAKPLVETKPVPFDLCLSRDYYDRLALRSKASSANDSFRPLTSFILQTKTTVDYSRSLVKSLPKKTVAFPDQSSEHSPLARKISSGPTQKIVNSPKLELKKKLLGFVDFNKQIRFKIDRKKYSPEYDLDYSINEFNSKYHRTTSNFCFQPNSVEKFESRKVMGHQRYFYDKNYKLVKKNSSKNVPDFSKGLSRPNSSVTPPYNFKGFYDDKMKPSHMKVPSFDKYILQRAVKI